MIPFKIDIFLKKIVHVYGDASINLMVIKLVSDH